MNARSEAELAGGWRDIAGSLFQARCDLLRRTGHHGYHAGRAAGEAEVGVEGTLSRRPVGGEHAAGRDGNSTSAFFSVTRAVDGGAGLIGGLCFVAPAFVIMLALTMAYATLGFTPMARGALYGWARSSSASSPSRSIASAGPR